MPDPTPKPRATFDLAGGPAPKPPKLPGGVVLRADEDAVIDALLADLFVAARTCVRTFGDFHLALDPSHAAEPALRRLMYDLSYREFPWEKTRLWLVQEELREDRATPKLDDLRDLIVEASGIPPEQVHGVDPTHENPARAYEALLREHLGWRQKGHDRIDYVLLAMHEDGGFAGIAPSPDGDAELVRAYQDATRTRVAMSSHLVNASHIVSILAMGAHLRGALRDAARTKQFMFAQRSGEVRWYLDHAACDPGAMSSR